MARTAHELDNRGMVVHLADMAEESGFTDIGPSRDSGDQTGRPGFVDFRNRIKRLVDSLVSLRSPVPAGHFGDSKRPR